jgi:hypothetical protein
MTRAIACLVRLDVASALRYHPLVLVAAPFGIGLVIDAFLQAFRRPGLADRMPRLIRWGWRLLLVCFAVVALVRGASWLAPECNPNGWLLPPAEFPPPPPDQDEQNHARIGAWDGAEHSVLGEAGRNATDSDG